MRISLVFSTVFFCFSVFLIDVLTGLASVTVCRNVIGGVAGLTADANSLVNFARTAAQKHLLMYNEDIPVELLTQRLCDMKQGYTQFGGKCVA